MTTKQMQAQIEELQKRVRDLEGRPVFYPYPVYVNHGCHPVYPITPTFPTFTPLPIWSAS